MKDFRSISLMALNNIRKKKPQSILIGMIILITAMMFSTAIGIQMNIRNPIEKVFTELKANHEIISFDIGSYDPVNIADWWRSQQEVEHVMTYPVLRLDENMEYKGERLDKGLYFHEVQGDNSRYDQLKIVEGEEANAPETGEVWVPTGFAYTNNMKVGDTFRIFVDGEAKELTISAIVVDAQRSSSLMGNVRLWVAPGELSVISPKNPISTYNVAVYYFDSDSIGTLWNRFENYLSEPYTGKQYDNNLYMGMYTMIYDIIGTVLLAFSGIILLVAVFIIYFALTNAIMSDYKIIGILKAEGFTKRSIRQVYTFQYLSLSMVAIPIGIVASSFVLKILMHSLLKAVGIATIDSFIFVPSIITIFLIIAIILLATRLSSRKATAVKPVEAIRFGAKSSRINYNPSFTLDRLRKLPVTWMIAIKQILTYKAQNLLLFFVIMISAFVDCACINSYNSILELKNNLPYWGFDDSEISVQVLGAKNYLTHEEIEEIKQDERVRAVASYDYAYAAFKKDQTSSSILYEVIGYDGDLDSMGLLNQKGRNPANAYEVSLGINLSKAISKDVGDYVDFYIGGVKKTFLVTGVFQTMFNGGSMARFTYDGIQEGVSEYSARTYIVKLNEGTDVEAVKSDLTRFFGANTDIKDSMEVNEGILSSITISMSITILVILIVFVVVSFVTIVNITMIGILEQRGIYGIYKGLGFSEGQIRRSILIRIFLLGIVAIGVGILLSLLIIPNLLGFMLTGIGISKFPFIKTGIGTILIVPLCMFIALISGWVPSSEILKIKPKGLINE